MENKNNDKAFKDLIKLERKALLKKEKEELKEVKKESSFLDRFKKKLIKDKKNQKKKIIKEKHKKLNEPPRLYVEEEIGNAISHGAGCLITICFFVLMLIYSNTPLKVLASCFYGISMIVLMLNSCLYHAFKSGSTVKRIWRRFDYLSIYLLIGGTYAPIFLVNLGGTLGIVLFIIQWAVICAGVTICSIFGPGRFKWVHFVLYFVIGWAGILIIPKWISSDLPLLIYILAGGAVYTLGMIPFAMKNKRNAHLLWHMFVLAGCFVQWLGIFLYIYMGK